MLTIWITWLLNFAFDFLNQRAQDLSDLLLKSPTEIADGRVWETVETIYNSLFSTGASILLICLYIGILKKCRTWVEVRHVAIWLPVWIEYLVFSALLANGLAVVLWIIEAGQGLLRQILTSVSPDLMEAELDPGTWNSINNLSTSEALVVLLISLIGALVIIVLSFMMILPVFKRFFKLSLLSSVAPITLPLLSTEASRPMGISYLKALSATVLEAVVIVIAIALYNAWHGSIEMVFDAGSDAFSNIMSFLAGEIYMFLILNTFIKSAENTVREIIK